MDPRVKDHEGELSSTRKQYEEDKANEITIGEKLNQAEKETRALRIQNADAVDEVNRYEREIEEREQKEKEEQEKKEKEERVKKESEERQIKEWCQKMETRVKDIEGELSSTRTQYEEAKANAITIGEKLNQAEKEIKALRIQFAEVVDEVNNLKREKEEREKKEKEEQEKKEKEERERSEREIQQIQAYHQSGLYLDFTDDKIKTMMCTKCQGWLDPRWCGFNCNCD